MDDLPESSLHLLWRVYKLPLLLGGVSFFFVTLSLMLIVRSSYSNAPIQYAHADGTAIENSSNQSSQSANLKQIAIDIEGAIVHPGVIILPAGSRIEDGIHAAGGFTQTADTEYIARQINRAMKVADGMKIYIPFKNETSHIKDSVQRADDTSYNLDPLLRSGSTSQNGSIVSINMASKEQLDTLTGVGPVTSQKIIDNRPYQTLEELVSKKAVGQALFTKIKPLLSL